jgi:hypothetical protein
MLVLQEDVYGQGLLDAFQQAFGDVAEPLLQRRRVLIEVLSDPDGARRIAERALDRLRGEFDPEAAADRYDQLLHSPRRA